MSELQTKNPLSKAQSNIVTSPSVIRLIDKPSTLQPHQVMKLWRAKPKIFFRDVMDVKLDDWQDHCCDLYMNHQRLGLIASKGPGKTGLLAFLGWHFFITNHQPKMAALSVSKAHLMANLWAELLKWRSQSKLLTMSSNEGMSRITLKGVAEGFSFIDARAYPQQADETQMNSALAGLHADNIAFLIDEAGSIPDSVLATADAALAGEAGVGKNAKLLVTANPEEPRGMLYRASKGQSIQEWAIYNISGDPDDPKRAPRVSLKWAQEQIATYGRSDPWVMVNVLGQYPNVSTTKLISEDEVAEAMRREYKEEEVATSQHRLGVDVARGGIDNTALARRKGLKSYPIEGISSNIFGPELAGKIAFMQQDLKIERVFVDNTGGYGSSVIDSLSFFPAIELTPVIYNSKPQDKRYYNKRTEMWVRMRDWIRKGGSLAPDPGLAQEIMMPNVYFVNGVFRLEEKEQIKVRLGRSPDKADALAQTFADIEQPSMYPHFGMNGERYNSGSRHISEEGEQEENPFYRS